MWRRLKRSVRTRPSRVLPLRRRSLAPSRPALYPDQIGLALFTLVALGMGTYVVLRYLL